MRPPSVRPSHLARLALAALGATILAACGASDGGPTTPDPGGSPDDPPTPPATGQMVASADTVRPYELVALRPTGLTGAVPDTITGTIGSAALRAVRADDSTLVAIVPTGLTGAQTARFTVGERVHTVELVLAPPAPTASDPTVTATMLFDRVLARLDTLEASLAASAGELAADTATLHALTAAGRASIERAREDFLSLSTEERAAAIPIIVAEAAAQGVFVDDAASARRTAGVPGAGLARLVRPNASIAPLCTAASSFDACAALSSVRSTLSDAVSGAGRCALNMGKGAFYGSVFGGVVLGTVGFLLPGVGNAVGTAAGIHHGAHIGAGIALAVCLTDAADYVKTALGTTVKPVLQEVTASVGPRIARGGTGPYLSRVAGPRLDVADGDEAISYTVGVAQPVDVYVEFHSLSAGDAAGPAPVAELVGLFNQLAGKWEAFRASVSVVDLPALALPASPRTVVRKRVPGSYLGVATATPTPISGASAGADQWTVTFSNPGQGDDLEFSYDVRFTYPGFPDQQRTLTGLLRPSRYAVAALDVTPAVDTVMVGQSVSLAWAARDSSGDVLTDAQLAGRAPVWTSAQTSIATVGATSGTVTGAGGGIASIAAELEEGRATASVLSVPDITGTYTLVTVGGVSIPGITWQDSTYTIVTSGGSVTLRADGTFGYTHSATGTSAFNGETYDEGGSGGGTYTVDATGTAITFETTHQEGEPFSFGSGTVVNGTLTASVTTPDGSGSATLQKQP